ncbi:MAG: IS5 family transposase, partial [Bacteroidota bacterium]
MNTKDYSQSSPTQEYVKKRINRKHFLQKIDQFTDWDKIDQLLNEHYSRGKSTTGRKAYPALVLFKMSLLQTWYGLSDYEVEDAVKDRLSFMNFCSLRLEDDVPDHSVLSRFRTELTEKNGYELILQAFNAQIAARGLQMKKGVLVDASITDSPRKPKGGQAEQVSTDGEVAAVKSTAGSGGDKEAIWVKKGSKLRYGYKRHYTADEQTGLVLSVVSSTAKAHETKYLESCLEATEGLSRGTSVYTDKGYASASNASYLSNQGY